VRNRTVDAVLAWHPDRLHRSPLELEEFIDIIEAAQIPVVTVQGGEYDLSTASGRMTARVVGAVARHESEHKSERIRRKHEELARKGAVSGGGDRPFGYEPDRITIRRREATLIREGAHRILAGESLRSVVRRWNGSGIKTSTGRGWYTSAVQRVLNSARIAGLREYRGELYLGIWPAIVDRSQWERLRAVLTDPARRTNRTARKYLLTGLLRCGMCGAKLVARPRSAECSANRGHQVAPRLDKARRSRMDESLRTCLDCGASAEARATYVCASGPDFGGCGKIRRLAGPVDDLVSKLVIFRVDGSDLRAALEEQERAVRAGPDRSDLGSLEGQLEQLARDHANGRIGRREWLAARDEVQTRVDALRASIRREQRTAVLSPYLRDRATLAGRWADLSVDERRAILKVVLDKVVVHPAIPGRNKFDPSLIEPVWRI
ncbi:MAG: recombinase family protein, partial [Elusimicrobia bacterium]|nr:recombinase family protein [Elusimicrobiota bacterium]